MPSKPRAKAHVGKVVRLPSKKNDAAQPIGRGKAGTMKRELYKAGMGKKALETWRSASKATRKANKGGEATSVIRGMRASRKARGVNPTTNSHPAPPTRMGPVSGQVGKLLGTPVQKGGLKGTVVKQGSKAQVKKVAAKVTARSGKTGSDALKKARKIVKAR